MWNCTVGVAEVSYTACLGMRAHVETHLQALRIVQLLPQGIPLHISGLDSCTQSVASLRSCGLMLPELLYLLAEARICEYMPADRADRTAFRLVCIRFVYLSHPELGEGTWLGLGLGAGPPSPPVCGFLCPFQP